VLLQAVSADFLPLDGTKLDAMEDTATLLALEVAIPLDQMQDVRVL